MEGKNLDKILHTKVKVKWILDNELSLINDENLKNAVMDCLISIWDEFKSLPSSLSGKYHPEDERGEGGLLLHSKRVVYLVTEMLREFPFRLSKVRDELIVSAICHDIGNVQVITYNQKKRHPSYSFQILEPFLKKCKIKRIRMIKGMIENHMSHWYGQREPKFFGEQILCVCDYIASRNYYKTPILEG